MVKRMGFDDLIGGSKPKRKPVSQSARTKVLVRAKGKCESCGSYLDNVKPHIHHKDGNPRNNKLSNLQVLCPNCHSRKHDKPRRKSKEKYDPFGLNSLSF